MQFIYEFLDRDTSSIVFDYLVEDKKTIKKRNLEFIKPILLGGLGKPYIRFVGNIHLRMQQNNLYCYLCHESIKCANIHICYYYNSSLKINCELLLCVKCHLYASKLKHIGEFKKQEALIKRKQTVLNSLKKIDVRSIQPYAQTFGTN